MSHVRQRLATLALAVCTTALAACGGDSTGPNAGTLGDPAALSNDMQTLQTPFDAPVLESFDVVALSSTGTPTGRLVSFLSAMSPRGKLPSTLTAERKQAAVFRSLAPALATRPSLAVIPVEARGAVYEWDTATDQYVESAASGPANGVRFVLYAINPLTHVPAEPLAAVGYADFLDESSGTTNRLHVQVVGDDAVTYADYTVSGGSNGSTASASAAGFLTNGTRRLDFTAELGATASAVTLEYTLDLNQPAISAALAITLSFTETSAVIENTFSITRGTETVVLDGTLTLNASGDTYTATANFTVNVNGGLFATISGSSASGTAVSYTMTGPGGRALTAEERDAIERLFDAPSQLDSLITLLFEPLQEIFGGYSTGD
jgi:hypothetical protein